jgi:hypothetical protein
MDMSKRLEELAACQLEDRQQSKCSSIRLGGGMAIPNAPDAKDDRGWAKIKNLDPTLHHGKTWGQMDTANRIAMVQKFKEGKLVRNLPVDTAKALQMRKTKAGVRALLSMFCLSESVGALATPLGQEWQSLRQVQELQNCQLGQEQQSQAQVQEPQSHEQLPTGHPVRPQAQTTHKNWLVQMQPLAKPSPAAPTRALPFAFGLNSAIRLPSETQKSNRFHTGGVAAPHPGMLTAPYGKGIVAPCETPGKFSTAAPWLSLTVADWLG